MKVQTKEAIQWVELTDEQWARIAPLIPPPRRQGKRKRVTDRQMVEALLYRERTKTSWSKLPGLEDAHLVVVKRYTRWRDDGTLDLIFDELDRMGLLPRSEPPEQVEREPEQKPEWWELTDGQWDHLAHLLLPEGEVQRRSGRYTAARQTLNILLYREYTDCPWRELPEGFGPWRTIYNRYVKWKENGSLDRVFEEMKTLGILSREKYLHAQQDILPDEERDWWELTDEQWESMAHLFPAGEFNKRGKKTKSSRQMVNAILCKHRTKTIWVGIPEKYGSWRTVIERYRKWRDDGTLQQVFHILGESWPVLEEEIPAPEPEREPEWWELTEEQWEEIAVLLSPEAESQRQSGRHKTDRQMLNALLYREYTDCPWRELPRELGAWRTVHDRYSRWKREGSLEQIFSLLRRKGVMSDEKYLRGRENSWDVSGRDWWEVTDEQWARILPLFPTCGMNKRGRRAKSTRQVLNAILCRYHNGTPWLDLPKKYGPWRTVIQYYQSWRDDGTLDRVFTELNK